MATKLREIEYDQPNGGCWELPWPDVPLSSRRGGLFSAECIDHKASSGSRHQ